MILVSVYSGLFSGLGVGLEATINTRSLTEMPRLVANFVELTRLQMLAHNTCRCIDDRKCIYNNMAKFEDGVSKLELLHYTAYQHQQLNELQQIVRDCVITYENIESRSQLWENIEDDNRMLGVEEQVGKKFEYQTITIPKLIEYRDKVVMITLTNGLILHGRLMKVMPTNIQFHEFTHEGYNDLTIHNKDIDSVKIRNDQM